MSVEGEVAGKMVISHFVVINGRFDSALVSFPVAGLDPTWPECDFEFMKYRIDEAKGEYFPTRSEACPLQELKLGLAKQMAAGQTFKFSASGYTGSVSLDGFKDAWAYALSKVVK